MVVDRTPFSIVPQFTLSPVSWGVSTVPANPLERSLPELERTPLLNTGDDIWYDISSVTAVLVLCV